MSEPVDIHNFDVDPEPDRERFEIEDDEQAAWAMRKLLHVRRRMGANERMMNAEITRIEAWRERVDNRFQPEVDYFEAILTQYAHKQRSREDRKTIDTPYGVVKSRSTSDKFKVVDEEKFLEWASENLPDAVSVKITPSVIAIKEASTVEHTRTLGLVAMTEHGEIIPGVTVEPGGVNYTVEVTE